MQISIRSSLMGKTSLSSAGDSSGSQSSLAGALGAGEKRFIPAQSQSALFCPSQNTPWLGLIPVEKEAQKKSLKTYRVRLLQGVPGAAEL